MVSSLRAFKENFLASQHSIVKDFLNFVQVLDSKNLTDMFKCQLKNKHQVEFAPSFTTDELEESVD